MQPSRRRPLVLALLLVAVGALGAVASSGPAPNVDYCTPQPAFTRGQVCGDMARNVHATVQPIDIIFGGSLPHPDVKVLLLPPAHGDLGNPLSGPSVLDYQAAILRGIHKWNEIIPKFADEFPQYDYVRAVTATVEIWDGVSAIDPAGFDFIIAYTASGPVFRGVAVGPPCSTCVQQVIDSLGLGDDAHYSSRFIVLSLFANAPRAGQFSPDFPEVNDIEIVTMHEFAHVWGVGHTQTWFADTGPDLMNSPYAYIYGDGSAVGDGGERTPLMCISSLDLYALARVYEWLPSGTYRPSAPGILPGTISVTLPADVPYKLYC
ncbi:MAG TPA: hypothetical protein VM681_03590 [Candidatus Thermoplasmatota archaeon]|nr:hypothetical protein [Candidatus Thermoplasmatota archaeon]